ncbi:Hpt domain-containing protein [Maridesulfovibrio sp. FT414]|uniref:Hpt domain-containing protein n=1 Tax=Maridesulfovibrio sp. FT414 TaxID=2979469 RepID=UPI003D8019DE
MYSDLQRKVENHLLMNVGLPAEQLNKFIRESAAHLRSAMSVLDEAIDEGDFEVIISSAHKLKGGLSNLGLEEFSEIAGNIEITAAGNTPAYLGCYFMRLRMGLKAFLEQ